MSVWSINVLDSTFTQLMFVLDDKCNYQLIPLKSDYLCPTMHWTLDSTGCEKLLMLWVNDGEISKRGYCSASVDKATVLGDI